MADTPLHTTLAARAAGTRLDARMLALTTLFAALTAAGAHVAVRVPFTPVPVTLQVFFVLLSGAVLGRGPGALSQVQYLGLGLAGLPVFTGGNAAAALAGPTAGYLCGFVLSAWIVGAVAEGQARPGWIRLLAGMAAGIAAIHLPGVLWLTLWLQSAPGIGWGEGLARAAALGTLPFIAADLAKAALAAGIARRVS